MNATTRRRKGEGREKKGRMEGESVVGMEDIKVLDFRTAFQGSVFEKYHILPLQVASFDTCRLSKWCEHFIDLQMKPDDDGDVDDDDAHAEYFANRLKQQGLVGGGDSADCHTFVKNALMFFEQYTDELYWDFCCQTGEPAEDPEEYHNILESELEPSDFCEELQHFLFEHLTSDLLENCFGCFGTNLKHESDTDIAQRLYDYGRWMRAERNCAELRSLFMTLHQIDFDLIGMDGQHFPLRMLLLEEKPNDENGPSWCAEVSDRENGALIADSINKEEGWKIRWRFRTKVRSTLTGVVERYKPHGDIPTMLIDLCWCDELFGAKFIGDCRQFSHHLDPETRRLLSELTPEQLKSVNDLKQASFCQHNWIIYSTHSEFERLIPIAANMGPICGQARKDFKRFDEVVDKYRLRPSLLRDVVEFQCQHFRRILKGTIWQNLPQELVIRIAEFLPRRCTISRCLE
ncbi:hypothetical protein CBR_g20237 [Chara braunii]|uniref:Uncharacterized protein n=1 Tax=Chara braunii TaxID=69332 RepID=A0A388KZX2_CHABU|nr:hypothetical protein CBR_g20237 [Chara braunii]|eukprot:GBG75606.1 hypothetical protein CBR_g20237 [Chara braunii]